jgi:hypothetical protein
MNTLSKDRRWGAQRFGRRSGVEPLTPPVNDAPLFLDIRGRRRSGPRRLLARCGPSPRNGAHGQEGEPRSVVILQRVELAKALVHPRISAAILRDEGYDARILSHCYEPDGGLDILAIEHRVGNVETRFAVQCMRYKRERKVGVQPIRELAAVLDRHRAHQGMIVTTSFFTRNATKEADTYFCISLRDYDSVVPSLLRYGLGGAPRKLASD